MRPPRHRFKRAAGEFVAAAAPVLARAYARPLPLAQALAVLAGDPSLEQRLAQPGDTRVFTHFLARTLVCLEAPPPAPQQPLRLSQRCSQEQVVLHAVDRLVAANSQNVLRNGYEKKTHGSSGFRSGLYHAQLAAPSGAGGNAAALQGAEWVQLLGRVGDELMLLLLLHASIFAPLPGGNLLQLTGRPLAQALRERTTLPQVEPPVANWLLQHHRQPEPVAAAAAAADATAAAAAAAAAADTPAAGPTARSIAAGVPAAAGAGVASALASAGAGGSPSTVPKASTCRPPRWLRRKLKLQQLAAAAAAAAAPAAPGDLEAAVAGSAPLLSEQAQQAQALLSQSQQQPASQQLLPLDDMESCDAPATQVLPRSPMALWDFEDDDASSCGWADAAHQGMGTAAAAAAELDADLAVFEPSQQLQPATQQEELQQGSQAARAAGAGAAAAAGEGPAGAAAASSPGRGRRRRGRPPDGAGTRLGATPAGADPSSWVVPRPVIFHCATFSSRAGLPASHAFNQLHGQPAANHRLYASIFRTPAPPHNLRSAGGAAGPAAPGRAAARGGRGASVRWQPQRGGAGGRGGTAGARLAAGPPVPPQDVRRHHKPLLRLLGRMMRNAQRCPFLMLLDHHCPLPSCVQTASGGSGTGAQQHQPGASGGPRARGPAAAGPPSPAAAAPPRKRRALGAEAPAPAGGAAAAGRHGAATGQQLPVLRSQQQEEQQQVLSGLPPVPHPQRSSEPHAQQLLPALVLQTPAAPRPSHAAPGAAGAAVTSPAGTALPARLTGGSTTSTSPGIQCGQGSGFKGRQQRSPGQGSAGLGGSAPLLHDSPAGGARQLAAAAAHEPAGPATVMSGSGGGTAAGLAEPQHAAALLQQQQQQQQDDAPPPSEPPAPPLQLQQQQQQQQQLGLAAHVVPHARVVAFVWSAIRHVVPAPLLGSRHNRQVLHAAVSTLVRCRRHEVAALQQLMRGMRISGMPWLQRGQGQQAQQGQQAAGAATTSAAAAGQVPPPPPQQQQQQAPRQQGVPLSLQRAQRRWLACWVWWLLVQFVLPLLRNSFYVTESEPYRQAVFYYRKPVWARLAAAGLSDLTASVYQQVTPAAAAALLRSRTLGVSTLRLLPKRSGLRPISRLSSFSVVRFRWGAARGSRAAAPTGAGARGGGRGVGAGRRGRSNGGQAEPGGVVAARQPGAAAGAAGRQPGAGGGAAPRGRGGLRLAGAKRRWWAAEPAAPRGVSRLEQLTFKPVNKVLEPAFQALRAEVASRPGLLGASVFSLDDMLRVLHPFLRRFRAAQAADPSLRPYILSADVRRAFDSVSIDRLLALVSPLLSAPSYQQLRYVSAAPMLGSLRVRYLSAAVPLQPQPQPQPQLQLLSAGEQQQVASAGAAARALVPAAAPGPAAAGHCIDFVRWVRGAVAGNCNTLYSEQVPPWAGCAGPVRAPGQELLALLREHLTGNILRVGRRWLRQTTGIPQGSVASTLLCSLYLADLERTELLPLLPSFAAGSSTAVAAAAAAGEDAALEETEGQPGPTGAALTWGLAGGLAGMRLLAVPAGGARGRHRHDAAGAAVRLDGPRAAAAAAAGGASSSAAAGLTSTCGISALAALAAAGSGPSPSTAAAAAAAASRTPHSRAALAHTSAAGDRALPAPLQTPATTAGTAAAAAAAAAAFVTPAAVVVAPGGGAALGSAAARISEPGSGQGSVRSGTVLRFSQHSGGGRLSQPGAGGGRLSQGSDGRCSLDGRSSRGSLDGRSSLAGGSQSTDDPERLPDQGRLTAWRVPASAPPRLLLHGQPPPPGLPCSQGSDVGGGAAAAMAAGTAVLPAATAAEGQLMVQQPRPPQLPLPLPQLSQQQPGAQADSQQRPSSGSPAVPPLQLTLDSSQHTAGQVGRGMQPRLQQQQRRQQQAQQHPAPSFVSPTSSSGGGSGSGAGPAGCSQLAGGSGAEHPVGAAAAVVTASAAAAAAAAAAAQAGELDDCGDEPLLPTQPLATWPGMAEAASHQATAAVGMDLDEPPPAATTAAPTATTSCLSTEQLAGSAPPSGHGQAAAAAGGAAAGGSSAGSLMSTELVEDERQQQRQRQRQPERGSQQQREPAPTPSSPPPTGLGSAQQPGAAAAAPQALPTGLAGAPADGQAAPAAAAGGAAEAGGGGAGRAPAARPRRQRPDSVLLRLVDDFLVITTSRCAAEAVLARLASGFPVHNMCINPDKTQANFSAALPDGQLLQPSAWLSADGSSWVRWCGLLINTANLEIMADYTRYSGQHIATSLTLNATGRPGRTLLNKVLTYMRPKMHALLLDATINSALTMRLNIYQAFLLAFMKLHWAVRTLLQERRTCNDPRLVLRAIQGAINYTVGLVRSRLCLARSRLGLTGVAAAVSRSHIRWLGLSAARHVLGRKQAAYRAVLTALDAALRDDCFRHVRRQLAPVTAPQRSAVLDSLLY